LAFLSCTLVGVALACSGSPSDVGDAGSEASLDEGPEDAAAEAAEDGGDAGVTYPPSLVELSVSASSPTNGSSPIALVPAFSSSVYDYYVRCAAGVNALTVSMTASVGSLSVLIQPTTSPSLPMQTLSLHIDENQAIIAAATNATASTEYWVRCLPHDFPPMQMSRHAGEVDDAGVAIDVAPPGYYLVGNLMPASVAGSAGYAMVLDGNGVPVWYSRAPTGLGVADVDHIVPGVSFIPFSPTGGESFEIEQLNPQLTTVVAPTGYATDIHELRALKNGNFAVLSYPFKSGVDLTGLSVTVNGVTEALGADSVIQDCAVVEFNSTGSVTWTWLASDHFDPVKVSTLPMLALGASPPDGGVAYDVFHCNSVDIDPANENLLISAREMDSIFYVDRSTGKVVWKMGGPPFSLDNATYVSVADPFFRQHDARLLPGWSSTCNGGSGQISVFDNESNLSGPSRAVLYDVVVGSVDAGSAPCAGGAALEDAASEDGVTADGSAALDSGIAEDGGASSTATKRSEYRGTAPSAGLGSFRIGGDGSLVIGWGLGGKQDVVFTEVDSSGRDLVDFSMDGNPSYRAVKVPLNAFDINVLRSTAGVP
jgi:hypothetical protein